MRRIDIKKQFDVIKRELFLNKHRKTPYSKDVVKRRELLLFAQVFLAKYDKANTREDRLKYKIAYLKSMDAYFTWDK